MDITDPYKLINATFWNLKRRQKNLWSSSGDKTKFTSMVKTTHFKTLTLLHYTQTKIPTSPGSQSNGLGMNKKEKKLQND